jgi:hypothetical protein
MSYGAYRKHLAAAEAYDARARAHRARAERHRSLAFGGGEEDAQWRKLWAGADANWRFQANTNHRDYQWNYPAIVREDGTYENKDGDEISQQELHKYDDLPWEALPAHIQQWVTRKPPTIQARENIERKIEQNREYREWRQKMLASPTP